MGKTVAENKLILKQDSKTSPHFKTRARLLCQLGEQLIESESIALLELVKNAYDFFEKFFTFRFADKTYKSC